MAELITLLEYGQSLWLDYLDRSLVETDSLKQLVSSGVRGVTNNPSIFFKAITERPEYDAAILDLLQSDPELDELQLYHWLSIQDTQMAADVLRGVYDQTNGKDGFVSLEVSPHLAYDAAATVKAARHLWKQVNRPNLMIKVPATREGLPAMERLISEGINVNATLIFSVSRYQEVVDAYLRGLATNPEPQKVAGVASFFISRLDAKVDQMLARMGTPEARQLMGKIGVANARRAYQCFNEMLKSDGFTTQSRRGGQIQRLLWASTSTKNAEYPDLLYVDELIGKHTVTTVPPETLDKFMHHGDVQERLEQGWDTSAKDLKKLASLGIQLEAVTKTLEEEGVAAFVDSYNRGLDSLREKRLELTKHYAEH